jgi:hypothetical protein
VIKSAPYYWVACDGCGRSAQEHSEYAAWATESGALDEVHENTEWWAPESGGHYCPVCARIRRPEPPQ